MKYRQKWFQSNSPNHNFCNATYIRFFLFPLKTFWFSTLLRVYLGFYQILCLRNYNSGKYLSMLKSIYLLSFVVLQQWSYFLVDKIHMKYLHTIFRSYQFKLNPVFNLNNIFKTEQGHLSFFFLNYVPSSRAILVI